MEMEKVWRTVDGVVTEKQVYDVQSWVKAGVSTAATIAREMGLPTGDRRIDKALQLLKKAGRIRFDHAWRKWRAVQEAPK